jgi:hypothetical protein
MSNLKKESSMAEHARYRGLWGAVILQAKADIQTEPMGSIDFNQAVEFFTGGGAWARTRTAIGDYLDLHGDDLERLGRQYINRRLLAEGLEPLAGRKPAVTAPKTVQARSTELRLVAARPTAAPLEPAPPAPPPRREARRVNPFFPRGIYVSALASRA